jgi:hypothetical protein
LKSDRDRIQTCNRLIRSQLLYSVELRGLFFFLISAANVAGFFQSCKTSALYFF